MFPARRARPTLFQASRLLTALALAMAAGMASAQPLIDGQHGSVESPLGASIPTRPAAQEATPEAPVVTMATHHGGERWWISGEANIIFQGNLPFHSPYDGMNS